MIKVVNKYKHIPTTNDFYIGRGSVLGNPYTSIKNKKTKAQVICDSREESIERFREHILNKIKEKDPDITFIMNMLWKRVKAGESLNLVCYCSPKKCHGDVIKEIIESKL